MAGYHSLMLIDCPHCQARVNAETLKVADHRDPEEELGEIANTYRLALLRCPECGHLLAGHQSLIRLETSEFDPDAWSAPSRVWPEPVSALALSIPEKIRACLLEARKCLHATAYTASVAMSGRAIETRSLSENSFQLAF
jgi:DNA-directed RNA polymerase subunit RPC12/RpoP